MVAIPFPSSIPEKCKEGRRPIGYEKRVPKKGDIYWAEVTDRWVECLCDFSYTKLYCVIWEGDKMLDLTKPLYRRDREDEYEYYATQLHSGRYQVERYKKGWEAFDVVYAKDLENRYTNEPPAKKAVCKVKTVYYWNCPHCTAREERPNDLRGTTVTCDWCGKSFRLVGDENE